MIVKMIAKEISNISLVLPVLIISLLTGCSGDGNMPRGDLATSNCSASQKPLVPSFWAGSNVTDVTFLAVGDSQVFIDSSKGALDKNYDVPVAALNAFTGVSWASLGLNEPISKIRGLIMAGDITQNGRDARESGQDEYGVFTREYGLCGNKHLKYPVYEGYGNHDYREWSNLLYPEGSHPIVNSVSIRNDYRMEMVKMAPNRDGHYTWRWDNVYFINLNLTVSDTAPNYQGVKPAGTHDPRSSLSYLKSELARIGRTAPIVITHHYPPSSGLDATSKPDTEAYKNAIAGFKIISIIHGHVHSVGSPEKFNGIPSYHAGYALRQFENAHPQGTFRVFRITDNKLYSLAVEWRVVDPSTKPYRFEYAAMPGRSQVIDLN